MRTADDWNDHVLMKYLAMKIMMGLTENSRIFKSTEKIRKKGRLIMQ